MLQSGILNPHLNHLLSRIRHTNTLVIADWAFPYWPQIETVDISLVKGIPTIADLLTAIEANFKIGEAWMAEEYLSHNPPGSDQAIRSILKSVPLTFEPHLEFKKRVPHAIGLIRTGDITPYGNIIIESV